MQIVHSKLKSYIVFFLMFSGNSSTESLVHKRSLELTWPLFQYVKPKRAAILYYKKVVPLKFGFCSLGNEHNF